MSKLEIQIPINAKSADAARKEAIDIRLKDFDWSSLNDIFEEIEYGISMGWLHIEGVRCGQNQMISNEEKIILNMLGYKVSRDYVLGYTIEW